MTRAPLWTVFELRVTALTAIAVLLDGFDNLLLGFVIPALLLEWNLSSTALVPVSALSIVGMSSGTALLGMLGDRWGRRPVLIGSVSLFGACTLAGAFAGSLASFTTLRILASLGLGGTFPNATALVAECIAAQRRSRAISTVILFVPIGGIAGGLVAAHYLPLQGWRFLLDIGGVLPLMVAVLLYFTLPESPGFVQQRSRTSGGQNLICGADGEVAFGRIGFRMLLAGNIRNDTLLLWLALLGNSFAVYGVFGWAPTLVRGAGYSISQASLALSVFNLGGVGGALLGGWSMDRVGFRIPTVSFASCGALLAALITTLGWSGLGPDCAPAAGLYAGALVLGFCCCGLQPMLFALAASVYRTQMRAFGVGAAVGIGRLGAVGSAAVGVSTLHIGLLEFLAIFACALLAVAAGLSIIMRKPPPDGLKHRMSG